MGQSADQAISIGWLNVQSLRNKTDAVDELVRDRSLDVLALTWLGKTISAVLRRINGRLMGLLQLRYEHDSTTIRVRYNILRGVMCFRAIMNMSILSRCCRML